MLNLTAARWLYHLDVEAILLSIILWFLRSESPSVFLSRADHCYVSVILLLLLHGLILQFKFIHRAQFFLLATLLNLHFLATWFVCMLSLCPDVCMSRCLTSRCEFCDCFIFLYSWWPVKLVTWYFTVTMVLHWCISFIFLFFLI